MFFVPCFCPLVTKNLSSVMLEHRREHSLFKFTVGLLLTYVSATSSATKHGKLLKKCFFLVYNDVAVVRFELTVIVTINNTSTNPITLSRKRNVEKSTAVEIPISKRRLFISGLRKDLSLNRAKKLIAKCSKIIGGGKLFYAGSRSFLSITFFL